MGPGLEEVVQEVRPPLPLPTHEHLRVPLSPQVVGRLFRWVTLPLRRRAPERGRVGQRPRVRHVPVAELPTVARREPVAGRHVVRVPRDVEFRPREPHVVRVRDAERPVRLVTGRLVGPVRGVAEPPLDPVGGRRSRKRLVGPVQRKPGPLEEVEPLGACRALLQPVKPQEPVVAQVAQGRQHRRQVPRPHRGGPAGRHDDAASQLADAQPEPPALRLARRAQGPGYGPQVPVQEVAEVSARHAGPVPLGRLPPQRLAPREC